MSNVVERALIVCNGEPCHKEKLIKCFHQNHLHIACNGGTKLYERYGLHPDLIIGDHDSLSDTYDSQGKILDHQLCQDTNDLEKALTWARTYKIKYVDIIGAMGKRFDHTFKNMSLLEQFRVFFKQIIMYDTWGYMFFISSPFSISLPYGTIISLIPLSYMVSNIVTQGLLYPLNHENLIFGRFDGTSNQTNAQKLHISYEKGSLLLYIVDTNIEKDVN